MARLFETSYHLRTLLHHRILFIQLTSHPIQMEPKLTQGPAQNTTVLKDSSNIPTKTKEKSHPIRLNEILRELDEANNSEDEGIEDYKIGGYHPVHIGEVLLKRYVVVQKLGWGHFSTVWLCKDFKYNSYVAVKVQKSSPHYMEAALDEVQILQEVGRRYNDPDWEGKSRDDTHVVGLLNAFVHRTCYGNHFCMVFEILRCNLLEIIKQCDYEGVPLDVCQQICSQVLKGLDYLHRICGVIHTDLKPENVMVCLSQNQLQTIVDNGKLQSQNLFRQRMTVFKGLLGFKDDKEYREKQSKVEALKEKLADKSLTKNQKKNLKKQIRKQKQKENDESDIEAEEQDSSAMSWEGVRGLFDLKKGKIRMSNPKALQLPINVKIADLGNACWKHHHFSTQIQTRQYRSPEVILGQSYTETADIWSFGCMMYEMLTGDLLFQPRKTESWGKNDDHLAQMQELLGPFDPNFLLRTSKMKKYFFKNGKMKRFPSLSHYDLSTVLQLKNKIADRYARDFAGFLLPTLCPQPEKRATAQTMLTHSWLRQNLPSCSAKMTSSEHQELKQKFYDNQALFRCCPQQNLCEEASCEDNTEQEQRLEQDCKRFKMANIKLVDRSFTDLGYVGYCEGIDLEKLDACKNWQFSQLIK